VYYFGFFYNCWEVWAVILPGLLTFTADLGNIYMKIRINNLPSGTTEEDLETLFAEYGTIQYTFIPIDPLTCKVRRYGFVEMMWDKDAQKAVEALNGTVFNGNTIKVFIKIAPPHQQQRSSERPQRKRIPYRRND
jgi:RNA recognition motif-containing protein